MTLTYIEDHVVQALEKQIGLFKAKAKFEGFITSYSRQIQDLEDALFQIKNITIDNAVGVTLDNEGSLPGELRVGRPDTDYRLAIKAQIQINSSEGTIEDVLRACLNFDDRNYEIKEHFPAAFIVRLVGVMGVDDPTPAQFLALLQDVKPIGTRPFFQYSENEDDEIFAFSSSNLVETDINTGFGNDAGTTGGSWSDAVGD